MNFNITLCVGADGQPWRVLAHHEKAIEKLLHEFQHLLCVLVQMANLGEFSRIMALMTDQLALLVNRDVRCVEACVYVYACVYVCTCICGCI